MVAAQYIVDQIKIKRGKPSFSPQKNLAIHLQILGEAYRKEVLLMHNSVSSRKLEVNYAEVAIEYGTLALLMENLFQQPVLVMPLERSILHGSVTIYQWAIHVTTRINVNSPIAYATFRAAEVKRGTLGEKVMFPSEEWVEQPQQRAQQLQQQLLECIITLLKDCSQVSQVVAPARYRLPDEWVWSSRSSDERIVCRNGAWMLANALS